MHTIIKRLREQRDLHALMAEHMKTYAQEARELINEDMQSHPDCNHASGGMALGYLDRVKHHQEQAIARLDDAISDFECHAVSIDMRDENDDAVWDQLYRMAMDRGGYDRDVDGKKFG